MLSSKSLGSPSSFVFKDPAQYADWTPLKTPAQAYWLWHIHELMPIFYVPFV